MAQKSDHAVHEVPVNARLLLPGVEGQGEVLALAPFATPLPVQKGTQVLAVTVKSLEDAFSPIEVIHLTTPGDARENRFRISYPFRFFCRTLIYCTGTFGGAPLSFTNTTRNFAG
jgi:hypothetical protein